jgi:FemAB-related protein (PEP-CTERM system-associated)
MTADTAGQTPVKLAIAVLDDADTELWDTFVTANDTSTFFHLSGWRTAIIASCGFRPHYLYAHVNGAIQGVLPLFHVRSLLFGSCLSSTPFCVTGGPIGTPQAISVLLDAAEQLGHRIGVDHLEARNERDIANGWLTNDLYATFRRPIDPDPEKNMKAIPRKQRAMVRKGIQAGLLSEVEQSLENFFRIYSTSVRNLGTPVFPKAYFKQLQAVFGSSCQITTVFHEQRPVSSVMSFVYKNTVLPFYGGGLPVARDLKAYDFLYWEVMRRACESGLTQFDFGRSKHGAGSFSFKKNWGFEPTPLYYQYRLVKGKEIPNRNPMSPKYRAVVEMWKKLPLPIANKLGPLISPYLA